MENLGKIYLSQNTVSPQSYFEKCKIYSTLNFRKAMDLRTKLTNIRENLHPLLLVFSFKTKMSNIQYFA